MKLFESLDSNVSDAAVGSLEDNTRSFAVEQDQCCNICMQRFVSPRVLSCLHVFCEKCLTDMLTHNTIICPDCKQATTVGSAGVASLHNDYVITNILSLNTVEPCSIGCTSCNNKESAISRCANCTNFLCASCDSAHKHMRCFENHQVVLLKELRESTEKVTIHKSLFCQIHISENLKYYCFDCQVPICNDCLITHKGSDHHYELIADSGKRIRSEMENLLINAKTMMEFCDVSARSLTKSLTETQSQHDIAVKKIEDNYESFKTVLERCREKALNELAKISSERESKVMSLMQEVEESAVKIENAYKFTEKVLNQANDTELLSFKKVIGTQINDLIKRIPQVDVNFSLDFNSNYDKFNVVAQDTFGKLCTESMLVPKENTPPRTLPGMPLVLNKTNGKRDLSGSVTMSPTSFATSMQSSFDCNMSMLSNNFMMPLHAISPNSAPVAIKSNVASTQSNMSRLSIGNNLHRLVDISDLGTAISDNMPSTYAATSTHLTLADFISGDHSSFSSFQAMGKMGLNNNGTSQARRESSSSMDGLSFSNDFMQQQPVISPIGTMPSNMTDDVAINMNNGRMNNGRHPKAIPMQIRCKFGALGALKSQFNSPHGFCLGIFEEIVVADTNNHRIEVFEKNGEFKYQFGVPGKEEGQFWYPRKVSVMRTNGKFVVCDRGSERSRMQIFTKSGQFIKKIPIQFIDIVAGLTTTNQGQIIAIDSVSPTVFILSEDGDLERWFDCSDYVREPSDIAIWGTDLYICDFKGHSVNVFTENGTFQNRIGNEKITCFPNGIDVSDAGDILVGDSHGNRFHVSCFSRNGTLQSEFECPYVKVSRCCGLRITSEGYVVTLAKNNNHVLVLNTLYIQ